MANLKTKNVFIDTEAFDAANLNFESTAFRELVRLAQNRRIRVFLTTVTESEVLGHVTQRTRQAFLALEKFRNNGRMLRNVTSFAPIFADFNEQGAVAEVRKKFKRFLAEADVTVLDLMKVDAEAVFKDYFDKKPPFGEDKKKYEFPDAFAQQALTNWCEENDRKMYVVGADPDWQELKERSEYLVPIVKLREFISLAVKDEAEELTRKALRLYLKNLLKVESAIKEAFGQCGFYTGDVDGDVDEVTVTRLELDDPQILEVDNESATVSVSVDLDYEADVSYKDDDGGVWDGEDRKWLYRPTRHELVEESENFDVEVFIEYDPDNDNVCEVSCTIGQSFSVTVLPTDYELK